MCPAVPTTIDFIHTVCSLCPFVPAMPDWSPPSAGFPLPPLASARTLLPSLLERRRRLAATRPTLPFANALQNLDKAQIYLTHFHVDADDLHFHLVAEPVDLLRVLAPQQVRGFDEPVIVVGHRRYVNKALDEVLDQLDEETEGRDPSDEALELVADLVGHELDLLPLQQLALRIVGAPLHLRGVASDLWQLLGPLLARLVGQQLVARRPQRTMHHEIRIAANRRREMCVARSRKAEVSEVLGSVARLLHGAQHQHRNRLFFRFAVNLLQQLLEMPR